MSKKMRIKQLQQDRPWNDLYKELQGESERAAAVVGGAMVDDALYRLVIGFFVDDGVEAENLLSRSLSSLGAKTALCYCLGLITEEQRKALASIQHIRNHFAHQLHDASFADQAIEKHFKHLKPYGRFMTHIANPSPRDYFQTAVGMLVYALGIETMKTEHQRKAVAQTTRGILRDLGLDPSAA